MDLAIYHEMIDTFEPAQITGTVSRITGLLIEANGPKTQLGGMCEIQPQGSDTTVPVEVVGFRENKVLLMPYSDSRGIGPGDRVVVVQSKSTVGVGPDLLGRVVNGFGEAIDDGQPITPQEIYPLYAEPLNPLDRNRIQGQLDLGIKSINGLLTCGKGQRIGILAGSGVGKSTLLGMIARYTNADVNVIALVGERGREVREFIEKDLGDEGLKRSVVVTATSDLSPLLRIRSAYTATAIAEYFRDQGYAVNLMMDSVTRFAMAQREVGLSIGEPPTSKGYTPSVFSLLPRLLERAGTCKGKGTITGLYTVLVEGDDMNEPIADATRAILDGHIVLSRDLAAQDHYPPIDVLNSKSRVMVDVVSDDHIKTAHQFIATLATYKNAEDLINIGAYVAGSNPKIDDAIQKIDAMESFLKQSVSECATLQESLDAMKAIFDSK